MGATCCTSNTNETESGGCCSDAENTKMNEFLEFYIATKKELKIERYKIVDDTKPNNLRRRLETVFRIPQIIASQWIAFYCDYMILWAFNLLKEKDMELFPPFAIEMVLRTHILYSVDFENFVYLLTSGRFKYEYKNIKLTHSNNNSLITEMKENYEKGRQFIKENLYNTPQSLLYNPHKFEISEAIWEDFEITALKKEFNFCFLTTSQRDEIIGLTKESKGLIVLNSLNAYNLIGACNSLMIQLKLPVLNYAEVIRIPELKNEFKVELNAGDNLLCYEIDKIEFNSKFILSFAWEHLISKKEAVSWILEYKKFLFLIVASRGSIIYPSEKVDQVWQAHCQHNIHYMNTVMKPKSIVYDMCIEQKESEDQGFQEGYHFTLKIYEHYFGPPDFKLWPPNRFIEYGRFTSLYLYFSKRVFSPKQKLDILKRYYSSKTGSYNSKSSAKTTVKSVSDSNINPDNKDIAFHANYDDIMYSPFLFEGGSQDENDHQDLDGSMTATRRKDKMLLATDEDQPTSVIAFKKFEEIEVPENWYSRGQVNFI